MKQSSIKLYDKYNMQELGYDFMGYPFQECQELSYHHFLVPQRQMRIYNNLNKKPVWNGVLLVRESAHTYLHVIEEIEPEIFDAITSELFDEKIKGRIDAINLININVLLNTFESLHGDEVWEYSRQPVIKDKYRKRILKR